MKVIMLCAGYATRLYPLTKDTPKPLLPICGKPIIECIIEKFVHRTEINGIYIVTNHRFAGQFSDWAKRYRCRVPVEVIDDGTTSDENKLGAIGDLNFVIAMKKIAGDTLVVAGDNLFHFSLDPLFAFAQSRKTPLVLGAYDVGDRELARKYGIIATDQTGRITVFVEKPDNPPSTFASLGLYLLSAQGIALVKDYLAKGGNKDQPGHYMRWLSETYGAYAYVFYGQWFDIGDVNSYTKANEFFQSFKNMGKE